MGENEQQKLIDVEILVDGVDVNEEDGVDEVGGVTGTDQSD